MCVSPFVDQSAVTWLLGCGVCQAVFRFGSCCAYAAEAGGLTCGVFCNVRAYVSCRGYKSYPVKRTAHAVNQGGTADLCIFVLDREVIFCQGFFVCFYFVLLFYLYLIT